MKRHASLRLWIRRSVIPVLVGGLMAGGATATWSQRESLRLAGLSGGALSEADLSRGNHVLIFFAGWSPRCRDVVERANALQGEIGGGARFALIDFQESAADVRQFLSGKSPRAPVYLDQEGAFSKKYSVTQLPYVLVFRDGEVKARGRLDDGAAGLVRNALR